MKPSPPVVEPSASDREAWIGRCDGGDAWACKALAAHLYDEPLRRADAEKLYQRAARLFEARCRAGDAEECDTLINLYRETPGQLGTDEMIRDAWRRGASSREASCKDGYAEHCVALALMHDHAGDTRRALEILGEACAGGFAEACDHLGLRFYFGFKDTATDEGKAAAYFEEACQKGGVKSCSRAARLYQKDDIKDLAKAARLYEDGCKARDMESCCHLGLLTARGAGVAQDAAAGEQLLRRACEAGLVGACALLRSEKVAPVVP